MMKLLYYLLLLSYFIFVRDVCAMENNLEEEYSQSTTTEIRSKKLLGSLINNDHSEDKNKILIISQGNFSQYFEALSEIDPVQISFIAEKKAKVFLSKKSPCHISFVKEYFESGEVEYTAYQLYQKIPFQLIIAPSETDILRAAQLRTVLKLPGQNYESAIVFRDKIKMKKLLSMAGFLVPKFSSAQSTIDVLSFIHQNGLPVIIKPKRGYGSQRTKLLKNEEDVHQFIIQPGVFNEFHNGDFDVEEFIVGDMYHVDGLVYNGKLVISWPSKFISTCLQMTEGKILSSYLLPQEDPLASRLNSYTKSVLKALNTPENTSFHLEVFCRNDQFIICEIASRVGGGGINDVWKEGLGVDLKKEFIRTQAFLAPSKLNISFLQPIAGRVLFPPQKGKVLACPTTCSLSNILKYMPEVAEKDELTSPIGILGHIALFVFKASNESEILPTVQRIEKWVQESIKFEN